MGPIERLTTLFEKFPGIGPRQAQRFVQFLLRGSPAIRREIADAVQSLGSSAHQCSQCMRYFSLPAGRQAAKEKTCDICSNLERDAAALAVVASDADLAALEKSSMYHGRYFVLGGTISLASERTNGLRILQLLKSIPERKGLKEVILAFPANPEGDATAIRVREELGAFPNLKVTSLGRGLSTGSELEYADQETIKSALEGRR